MITVSEITKNPELVKKKMSAGLVVAKKVANLVSKLFQNDSLPIDQDALDNFESGACNGDRIE